MNSKVNGYSNSGNYMTYPDGNGLRKVKCAICNNFSFQELHSSCGRFIDDDFTEYASNNMDLDTRKENTSKEILSLWIQYCSSCGYCAPDITLKETDADKIMQTPEYKNCFLTNDDTINNTLRYVLMLEKSGVFADAGWYCLCAAWLWDGERTSADFSANNPACLANCFGQGRESLTVEYLFSSKDKVSFKKELKRRGLLSEFSQDDITKIMDLKKGETYNVKSYSVISKFGKINMYIDASRMCRIRAIENFREAKRLGQRICFTEGLDELVIIDLYRRTCQFDLAIEKCESFMKKKNSVNIANIVIDAIKLELILSKEKDALIHRFGEVKRHD